MVHTYNLREWIRSMSINTDWSQKYVIEWKKRQVLYLHTAYHSCKLKDHKILTYIFCAYKYRQGNGKISLSDNNTLMNFNCVGLWDSPQRPPPPVLKFVCASFPWGVRPTGALCIPRPLSRIRWLWSEVLYLPLCSFVFSFWRKPPAMLWGQTQAATWQGTEASNSQNQLDPRSRCIRQSRSSR